MQNITQKNSSDKAGPVDVVESTITRHLRRGFRRLRFAEPVLEQNFRVHHYQRLRASVRTHLWLGTVLLLIFLGIDQLVLEREQTGLLILIRVVAVLTLFVCTGVTASKKSWACRYYRWVQFLAPVFGLCTVANDLIDQPMGISFLPAVVLTLTGIYLLVGMLFVPALLGGLAVLASYVLAAWWLQLPMPELIYNGTVLLFTNIVGATACYTLERLQRTSFLEARLLADMANRDGLTGIHNRRALDEYLQRLWQQGQRENLSVALLLVDIDHFKSYNDFYGHQAGDQCLQRVAQMLARVLRRPLDFSARYGGEEFAIVLYNPTPSYAESIACTIQSELQALAIPHAAAPREQLTVSIGAVCVVPRSDHSISGLVQLADQALYEAKKSGRDRWVLVEADYDHFITGAHRGAGTQLNRVSA